jgi:DnaK suppressor protein
MVQNKLLEDTSGESSTTFDIPDDYKPSDDEPFMNPMQLAYFKKKLLMWKRQLLSEMQTTVDQLPGSLSSADAIDIACNVVSQSLELRTRDRERKLIYKIDEALQRIEDGSYGYYEETGEPISLQRLESRPIVTLSIEAQERHERKEKEYSA